MPIGLPLPTAELQLSRRREHFGVLIRRVSAEVLLAASAQNWMLCRLSTKLTDEEGTPIVDLAASPRVGPEPPAGTPTAMNMLACA